MAASAQNTLEGIERRRAQLQDSVDNLRKALAHWTTWEAEYQTLKDEIEDAEDASPAQIREMARGLDSALLNDKEVEELLGKDPKTRRTANQVADLISRRIDYVQQNSATIEKQLDAAEKQLAGVDVLLEPGVESEDGLPMMDIEEELDEEGNEVGSSISQTGNSAAEVIEVLRKAGLQKLELEKTKAAGQPLNATSETPSASTTKVTQPPAATLRPKSAETGKAKPISSKKRVSFAEDVHVEDAAKTPQSNGNQDAFASMNFSQGTKVIELEQDDDERFSHPIIPENEDPEDAELRRQMLQYGLSEVGQIVAELELDQPTASYSDDEDEDDYDYGTEEEDEDDHGRSTRPVVTEAYRQQMLELEKKLNARMMENVGPDAPSLAEHVDDVRTLRIRRDEDFDQSLDTASVSAQPESKKKKGVRFADDVHISTASPVQPPTELVQSPAQSTSTISDTIIERPASTVDAPAPPKPAKVSRFKSARSGSNPPSHVLPTPSMPIAPPVPSGPTGRTLANTVVEHTSSVAEPNAPDEFDPVLLNREIQTEYHKARNKYIQQQGGFTENGNDEESPIVEEKNGQTKKVSRFMAARLKADGM
jgi:unconventional prefoldin RPB5 interactor 1